jgi:DNA-binding CsgD family transcriptional regulator
MNEIDVRTIVRLLGDTSLLRGGLGLKKRFLLARLCALIGGDAWSWSISPRAPARLPDGPPAGGELEPNGPSPAAPSEASAVHDPANVLTVRQISEEGISSVILSRRAGRPPFSPRERKIAQIVLSEITWLHEDVPEREKALNPLSPRQRATLGYLANGLPRRAIAEQLRLSQHTIDGYVKAIYQHYQVNSRATLMKRFAMIGGEELPR